MPLLHVELLVEERSMGATLEVLLPQIAEGITFKTHVFDGKRDLLRNLERRLRGYASMFNTANSFWKDAAVIVMVDEDREDCRELKAQLDLAAKRAGLGTLSRPIRGRVHVLNRIAIEELESWFFGDPAAVIAAYPKVKQRSFPSAAFRNPDGISGGTWEALERVLNKHGYHMGGLRKTGCASGISAHMDIDRNRSPSFRNFRDGVARLIDSRELS